MNQPSEFLLRRFRLSPSVRRTLASLAEAVVPAEPAISTAGIVDFIEGFVPFMSRSLSLLFPLGVHAFELSSLFVKGRTFSRLSPDARQAYVEKWIHARSFFLREIIRGFKGLCLLAYYSDPQVCEYLGYRPQPYAELVAAERLHRHGHSI